ncbi:hypothetical protein [Halarcobacter anaerophilus]|uniref:Uncharacterized protein n=1 Tax=Halarcobacter anaerophilus TaxID=877500 RepID=A0A4V1LPI3_9BACT|nr:hypothetical protein [Halarcobacter anaerophilus]QDF28476.1 hypothetical protein AANAER_0986 [Halarcobacter anaerophilus]RXJ61298.1 hypothetical protein CRV06_14095 [Halarcobacter anaerophilus]
MGNEYNVIEEAVITCACGGKVTLTSTVPNLKIAGKKPLYLKDILGAPVSCPRSINPCTKVASISTAGTEVNVSASGLTYLLRTDGFKTDKGRAVILKNPGQGTSKISSIPSLENQDVVAEEKALKEENIKIEEEVKTKYELYLLRKSGEIYKPIRPSRAFRKADETYVNNQKESDFDNIYSHTLAFVYLVKNNEYIEYKIYNSGGINAERVKDIYYHDTKNEVLRKFIPLEEDTKYQIYYSNFKLNNIDDIQKLPKLEINPKTLGKKNGIYIKDIDSIDKNEIEQKLLNAQTPKNGEKNSNIIVGFLEDIIGEIEDLYEEYYTNYKLAFSHNKKIFDDIKKKNTYGYTVANLVDLFHIDEKQQSDAAKLSNMYARLILLLYTDKTFVDLLFSKPNLAEFLDKETMKIAKAYMQETAYLNKTIFNKTLAANAVKQDFVMDKLMIANSGVTFNGTMLDYNYRYAYYNKYAQKFQKPKMSRQGFKTLEFYGSDSEFTTIQEDARLVAGYVMFAIFFSNKYEEQLKASKNYDTLYKLREEFYIHLKLMQPLPNIGSNNIRDIKNVVEKQKQSYNAILTKEDKFLEEFENLNNMHKIKSYEANGGKVNLSSKFIYTPTTSLYKDSGVATPKSLLPAILSKLKDNKLASLLKIYQSIEYSDDLVYTVSNMNIMHLLSAPRILIEQEGNETSPFNSELTHIYNFMIHTTEKRKKLSDDKKDIIFTQYGISTAYLEMQLYHLMNAYLQGGALQSKAQSFIDRYKKEVPAKNKIKLDNINDMLFDPTFKSKDRMEEFMGVIALANGISGNIIDILDEIKKNKESIRLQKIPHIDLDKLDQTIKNLTTAKVQMQSASMLMSMVGLGYFIYRKDKNFGNSMGAVGDVVNIVKISVDTLITQFKNKQGNAVESIMQKILQHNKFQSIVKSSSKMINAVGIPLVIISGTYNTLSYFSDEDYDASVVSAMKTMLSVSLLLSATIIGFILLIILELLWYFFGHIVIDSDIEKYLYKSLFYKTMSNDWYKYTSPGAFLIHSIIEHYSDHNDYKAYYLLEATNHNAKLKAIESQGFKSPKTLVNFIGQNYKTNEIFFDTALENEISFFKTAIYGITLQKVDYKITNRRTVIAGIERGFNVEHAVGIPQNLSDDEKFQFFYSPYQGSEYLDISVTSLEGGDSHSIFNLFPNEAPYYQNRQFGQSAHSANFKMYVIVLSSLVNAKYKIDIDRGVSENYIMRINDIEQISFTPEDKQFIEGKMK